MSLLDAARPLADDLVALRRDLHRHPELGFHEVRTSGVVADRLRALGLEPRTGLAETGVIADIANGDGPVIALRADMDALPIREIADHDYASTADGVMHACGHDAHTSGLIGAARLLCDLRDAGELPAGTVRLVFQPCEETVGPDGRSGARRLLDEGALDGVDAIVGLHVGAHLPSGMVFIAPGAVMGGAQEVKVTVRGVGAHAAMPDAGIDAIVLAAQGIQAVQTGVSRRIRPIDPGVITLGRIRGGTAHNVIADEVVIDGTIRWFDEAVHTRLVETLEGAFRGLESQGAQVEIALGSPFPPVVNDADTTRLVTEALTELVGEKVVPQVPFLGGEDFAYYQKEMPGCFFWVGAALPEPREHHHPRFDIDEAVLPTNAALLARSAIALLEAHAR